MRAKTMPLHFRRVSSTSVRDAIARGTLPELEQALLKQYAEKLGWSTKDKALFCDMSLDILEAQQEFMKMEVHVRSLCHAANVVADHMQQNERFNTRPTILLIGDVGVAKDPWTGLIQPAVFLFHHGFNVVCIELPEFRTSTPRWLKNGPTVVSETLRFLNIRSVHTLACGNGGAIFLEALAQNRGAFGSTHFVYNIDCPPGTKKAPFPVFQLEEHLRKGDLQFWFGFHNEEGVYNRYEEGTPRRSVDAVTGMQSRLEGERRRGRRSLDFDEVLITDALNNPKNRRVSRFPIGRNVLLAFSEDLLGSIARFLDHPPAYVQEELEKQGGLVTALKVFGQLKPGEFYTELPAMTMARLTPEEATMLLLQDAAPPRSYCRRAKRRCQLGALGDRKRSSSTTRLASLEGGTPSSIRSGRSSHSRSSSMSLLRAGPSAEYLEDKRAMLFDLGCED